MTPVPVEAAGSIRTAVGGKPESLKNLKKKEVTRSGRT